MGKIEVLIQVREEAELTNRYLLYLLMILLLSACANKMGGEAFFNRLDDMEQALDQEDWNTITQHAEELKRVYSDQKWKLQLLGDEGEYESLYRSINNLIAAIKEKDSVNVRLELATAKSLLEDIYSL